MFSVIEGQVQHDICCDLDLIMYFLIQLKLLQHSRHLVSIMGSFVAQIPHIDVSSD